MCKCTPEKKTPFCGAPGCRWPHESEQGKPTGTEARVCEDIAKRQQLGIAKYKTTVAKNQLELREWLEHAYQECLDQAVYLKRAMEKIDEQAIAECMAILENAEVKFWACPDCVGSHVKWEGNQATCIDCGRQNGEFVR